MNGPTNSENVYKVLIIYISKQCKQLLSQSHYAHHSLKQVQLHDDGNCQADK